jgi:hypothetical protein
MRKIIYISLAIIVLLLILFIPFEQPKIIETGGDETEDTTPVYSVPDENLSETYPQHPILADCEKTVKRDFCIDDVAEFNNNISLCYKIVDPDIRTFCIARISLNETMCEEVKDKGLREACLESIHLKKSWHSRE